MARALTLATRSGERGKVWPSAVSGFRAESL